MCVVSMVFDNWKERLPHQPYGPAILPKYIPMTTETPISRAEFEQLRHDMIELKELVKKALEYDKRNNEPHCEVEEKVELFKKLAKLVGVQTEDIFPNG